MAKLAKWVQTTLRAFFQIIGKRKYPLTNISGLAKAIEGENFRHVYPGYSKARNINSFKGIPNSSKSCWHKQKWRKKSFGKKFFWRCGLYFFPQERFDYSFIQLIQGRRYWTKERASQGSNGGPRNLLILVFRVRNYARKL